MAHNHVYGVCESKCFVEVAPLDTTTGKLKPEHLPTGIGANNIPLIKTLVAANQYLKYDVLSGGFIGAELDVAGVYTYKGTVATGSLLPTTGQAVGDVWNVESEWQGVPAGTNWAWTGSAWDALGGSIDLSSYVTNGQMQSALSGKQNTLIAGDGISIVGNTISATSPSPELASLPMGTLNFSDSNSSNAGHDFTYTPILVTLGQAYKQNNVYSREYSLDEASPQTAVNYRWCTNGTSCNPNMILPSGCTQASFIYWDDLGHFGTGNCRNTDSYTVIGSGLYSINSDASSASRAQFAAHWAVISAS